MKNKIGIYSLAQGGYQISYIDSFGARNRQKFNTLREARTQAQAIKQRFGSSTKESTELVSTLAQAYISQHPDSAMVKRSAYLLESFLKHLGRLKVHDLNKLICSQWLDHVKREKNYASFTMLQVKYAFTPFFEDLFKNGVIHKNFMAEVKIRKGTRIKNKVFLSETELVTVLDKLKEISPSLTHPVTYFLVHTGCKINEALSLKWDQIDFQKNTVHFYSSKTSDERTLRLSSKLLDYLKSWPKNSEYVFVDENNNQWTTQRYRKRITRDRAHVALERHWDNFSFRHTFAYHFLRKGRTLAQLQVILGHRSIEDTVKAYGAIISRDKENI